MVRTVFSELPSITLSFTDPSFEALDTSAASNLSSTKSAFAPVSVSPEMVIWLRISPSSGVARFEYSLSSAPVAFVVSFVNSKNVVPTLNMVVSPAFSDVINLMDESSEPLVTTSEIASICAYIWGTTYLILSLEILFIC